MNRPTLPTAPRIVVAAATLVLVSLFAACAEPTAEERVIALRSDFEASLNSFQVSEQPLQPVDLAEGEEAGAETVAGGEDATVAEPSPPVAVRQDVLLDIVLRNRSTDGRLPGLTLDIEQADAGGEPKSSYRVYVDTATMGPGAERAISHRLEDLDYAPGDGFRVEVRRAIPPEQRSEYRELVEIGEP